MELTFPSRRQAWLAALLPALLLLSLLWAALSMAGIFSLAPLAAALLPLLCAVVPRARRYLLLFSLLLLLAFAALRFSSLLDGLCQLANRYFEASAALQAYEYDFFPASARRASLHEALTLLCLLAGLGCAAFGNRWNTPLLCLLVLSAAYFGLCPAFPWLLAVLAALLLNLLPRHGLWLHALAALLVLALLALAVARLAPEPNVYLSAAEERLRDRLAVNSVFYERVPKPEEAPPTVETSPPPSVLLEPVSEEKREVNTLFLALLALTLLLLFPPAFLYDRLQKRRRENRAGLEDVDCAAAIRGMYLYAQKWLKFAQEDLPCPAEIYALWLEAAYSDHDLTAAQRQAMRGYMEDTARAVWQQAGRRLRLHIRYRAAL